ncbi:MAG: DUF1778 domain-containing protein [Acidobacteriota bacterium]|jgi:uncharacterized protein (DUF1778 family)|nr:DUF1778 domain-containing protein [Acidobacteriota bacterium]
MVARARFDLKMDMEEKNVVARAAAVMGMTMAGFMRAAAKEKALSLLERESRITLPLKDFTAFTAALDGAFNPNPALKASLERTKSKVRRV